MIASPDHGPPISVDLKKSSQGTGRTDIEIRYQNAHMVIEARRGGYEEDARVLAWLFAG